MTSSVPHEEGTRDVHKFTAWQGFPADLDQSEAEKVMLEDARAALQHQCPGALEIGYTFERTGPIIPGATVWGFDDEGEPIGDPTDWALICQLKVAVPHGWSRPPSEGKESAE